jgi:hypothetical protein
MVTKMANDPDLAPVVLSPERQHLAAAIAKVDEWEKYICHCRDALANLEAEVQKHAGALVAAENALKKMDAEGNAAKAALQRALNREATSPSPAAARRAAEAARVAYNEAYEQRSLTRTEIERLEQNDLSRAIHLRREAIAAVLRSEGVVDRLVAEREEVLARAHALDTALAALTFAMPSQQVLTWSYRPVEYPRDESIAGPLRALVTALESNAAAVLSEGPAPQPEAAAA